MSTVTLDVVKKYAPAAKFHSNEGNLPCSIEYLLEGSTLNYRTWRAPEPIPNQFTVTPAAATFNGYIYVIYPTKNGQELELTRSSDGENWEFIPMKDQYVNNPGTIVSMAVFQNKLWVVYPGRDKPWLYVSWSSDGFNWEYQQIDGQLSWAPTIAAYDGHLYMTYSAFDSSKVWWSRSSDGRNWEGPFQIDGQGFDVSTLVVNNNDELVMVYPSSTKSDNGKLLQSRFTTSGGWQTPQRIEGQQAYNTAITVCLDWLVMTYSSYQDSNFLASRSRDGVTWQDTQTIPGQHGSVPAMATLNGRAYMIYAGTEDSGQLYVTSVGDGNLAPNPPIPNPQQSDLLNHSDPEYWVNINESQWRGQPIPTAPMYYAVQEDDQTARIHYIFLYSKQSGQTVRARRAGTEFNCVIFPVGEHPGDIERYMVTLSKSKSSADDGSATYSYSFQSADFEAHGNVKSYDSLDKINWKEDTHAVVSIGLNGHGIWNEKDVGNPVWDVNIPGAVAIGDFFEDDESKAQWWLPWSQSSDFKLLGLYQGTTQPIGDQVWAAFCGRLGDSYDTGLKGAVYFDGSNLSWEDWAFVKIIWAGGSLIGKLPSAIRHADGPNGPGKRDWVKSTQPPPKAPVVPHGNSV